MEKENVQKIESKSVTISIRTYPKYAKWMKDNNVSPNAVFNEAMKELVDKK